MKLGIITFLDAGATREDAARLQERIAAWLQSQGHNVVVADALVSSGAAAAAEAERITNADCEGVLFHPGAGAVAGHVLPAALRVNSPILLAGNDAPAFFTAAGALLEVGIPFGRAPGDVDDPRTQELIGRWVVEHSPTERQKGEDAAQKLYGMRFALFGDADPRLDGSQWLSQFGIHVVHAPALPAEEIEAFCAQQGIDFHARDGDANGALTGQLLGLISEQPVPSFTLRRYDAGADLWTGAGPEGQATDTRPAFTLARITRRSGRFVCALLRGERVGDTGLRLHCPYPLLADMLAAPRLHAAPGDHVAAAKAACEALDIQAIVLR